MSGISVKAVVIGFLIDFGGGLIAAFVYFVIYVVLLLAQGVPQAAIEGRIMADKSHFVATMIMGFGFTAAGSYIAARIARTRELMHAGIVGFMGIVTGLVLVSTADTSRWPSWYIPVSFSLTLPVAVLSGYIAQRRHRHIDSSSAGSLTRA